MSTPVCCHGNGPECAKCEALDIPEVEEMEQELDALRARLATAEAERDAAKIELNDARNKLSVHPSHCPVTGRPFFMVIESLSGEMVATYGGPFDSYTIPEWNEGEFRSERYDHDMDGWVEGGEPYPFVRVDECFLNEHIATLQIIEGLVNEAGIAKELDGNSIDLDDRVCILMEQRDEAMAEREAALKRAIEARETAENYLGHCDASCKQLEATEAALLAAQSGEARAVELLRDLEGPAFMRKFPGDEALYRRVLAAIKEPQPALAWLAQQRAEAAAEWIEKEASKARRTMGEFYERSVEGMLEEAAALRAGATGGADAK